MSSLSIRNLDETTKKRLRIRAAENGRSMEAEARWILWACLADESSPASSPPEGDLGSAIHALFAPLGGVELDLPPREPMREPPDFS